MQDTNEREESEKPEKEADSGLNKSERLSRGRSDAGL